MLDETHQPLPAPRPIEAARRPRSTARSSVSPCCCKAAARSALTRREFMKRSRRPTCIPTGWPASR